MNWKKIGPAAGAITLVGTATASIGWVLGRRSRARRKTLRDALCEADLPQVVWLPQSPSIEYDPPSAVFARGIRRTPASSKLIAIMVVDDGLEIAVDDGIEIAIIDRPPSSVDWHYRNRRGRHGANLALALALDTRSRQPGPGERRGYDPHRLQRIMDQCRWLNAGERGGVSWKPYRMDSARHNPEREAPETG